MPAAGGRGGRFGYPKRMVFRKQTHQKNHIARPNSRTTPRFKSTIYIVEIEMLEVREKLLLFSHVPSVSMENKKYG